MNSISDLQKTHGLKISNQLTLTGNLRTANEYAAERRSWHKQLINPMGKVSPFNIDREKNTESHYFL